MTTYSVTYHNPGQPALDVAPGDIILTHSTFWAGRIIRFGQRLRWRGARKWAAHWNHCALVVEGDSITDRRSYPNGGEMYVLRPAWIVEALGNGVERTCLNKYDDTEYAVVHMEVDAYPLDTEQVLEFAHSVLSKRTHYGYWELLSLAGTLLTPKFLNFSTPGTMICSGFVAQALTRAGIIWAVDPTYAMPADIAEQFLVLPA